jgi:hypothetical protein
LRRGRGLHLVLGGARLVVAAAVIGALAYVLSWQILYFGPVGSDTLFHLHLARWVDSSFPAISWWYPWDDHGIGYREGYPLAAHWMAAAISRLGAIDLSQAIQVVQFATAPLGALGVYVFCAWRLRNPLAGLVAGIAYLLSPLTWTFLVDWGFYSNQVGTVLFMPAVIALDLFFDEWTAGRRGWTFRTSAFATMGLVALLGLVSPFLLGAAVIAIFMYALAIRGRGLGPRARWMFMTAPLLVVGTFLLTAFWSVPEQLYLSFIGTHVPARAFDPGMFSVWSIDQVFGLHPIRPTTVFDRASITPAVWLPAVAGALAALWNGRVRVLVALVAFGVLTMVTTALEAVTWGLPVLGNLVHERAGVTLVQFSVPVLAGIGLTEAPLVLGEELGRVVRLAARPRAFTAIAVVCIALVLASAGVLRFAHWVDGSPNALAYGDFQPSTNDIWGRYPPGAAPASDFISQVAPAAWRPLQVGCLIGSCATGSGLAPYRSMFATPPQRVVLDAHVPLLLMAARELTGGGQAYTYNFQLPTSPELDNWMLDSMLNHRGTTAKAELASAVGIDAVVLGDTQAAQGSDYAALGWKQVSTLPLAFVNPSPAGLATEWPSGATGLVIGADQNGMSHPYNDLFERATTGMIPFSSGWLLRGDSAYVDDYTASQLAAYPMLVLVGYRYHDRGKAFGLLDDYARAGGSLYIETGWQYVDPDWDLGSPAPAVLPVGELRWGALDPAAPVVVSGSNSTSWGSMAYGAAGSGWGASSAPSSSVRTGAEALVSVGGRVVVARQEVGRGRVFWSGMNLIAHSSTAGSGTEDQFTADAFAWLLHAGEQGSTQSDSAPTWVTDDQAQVSLSPSTLPTWALFRESFAPGWSAELQWPASPGITAGTQSVHLLDGEADFILARLDSVPPGAKLVFSYGPTVGVYLSWAVSAISLVMMLIWVLRPSWWRRVWGPGARLVVGTRDRASARFGWSEEEG